MKLGSVSLLFVSDLLDDPLLVDLTFFEGDFLADLGCFFARLGSLSVLVEELAEFVFLEGELELGDWVRVVSVSLLDASLTD